MKRFVVSIMALALWWTASVQGRAQYGCYGGQGGGGATQVLAHVDGKGQVVVRQFMMVYNAPLVPKAAPPKDATSFTSQPLPPPVGQPAMPTMQEIQFRFDAKHMNVRTVDGKPVDAETWQKTLTKDAAVLYIGYGYFSEGDKAEAPEVPLAWREIYKQGTLVLYGMKPPLGPAARGDAKGDAPKSVGPNFMLASIQTNKNILFRDVNEYTFMTKIAFEVKLDDGKSVFKEMEVTHKAKNVSTHEIPAGIFTVLDSAGKMMPNDRLPELLAKERYILRSQSGVQIDPFYLRLLRADALILALPQPPRINVAPPSS